MIEQITINGKSYTVTPDDQGYYTVDLSGENLDKFIINAQSICDNGIELSEIQINEGNTRKDFVPPMPSLTASATGMYKSISDLSLTLENAEQGLRQELHLTADSLAGRIEKIDADGKKRLQQTIVTVDGLRSDTVKAQKTADYATEAIHTLESTVDGLRSELSLVNESVDGKIENKLSSLTQTIDSLESQINQISKDVDGNIDAKVSQITQTVNGLSNTVTSLQKTVNGLDYVTQSKLTQTADSLRSEISEAKNTANGANRQISTLTQTVNGIKSKVNQLSIGAGGNVDAQLSQITQTVNSLSSSVTNLQRTVNGLDYVTQSKLTQTADSLRSEISEAKNTADGANKQISTLTQTAQGLQVSVRDLQRKQESQITQLNNLIRTQVTKDDVRSLISQSERDILMQVQGSDLSGQEIVSRINLTPDAIRIASNKIRIDGDTYISNATIKSSHIASLNADKITAGTLDAGKVRVINLDANNITANRTSFVQSVWNSIESSIRIDSGGLLSTASDGSQVYLQNGILGVRRPPSEGGGTIGQIGYVYDGGSPTYTIQTTWGASFAIKQTFYDSYTRSTKNKKALDMYTGDDGYSETTIRMSRINILGDAHVSFHFRHSINGNDNNRLTVNGAESVAIRARDNTIFAVSNNGSKNFASLHANLNMQGNTVTNTSDIRLKRDVVNDEIDSLSALMKWQHAGFNYTNPDMNQERQFSVIAQSAPDISFTGEDGYLQVSLNKQVNMTSHALQQHVIKTNDEITRLKEQIANLQDELALLKGDRR